MDLPPGFVRHLDALTEALQVPGADLQAMLDVLIDDLTAAVPSFLGLAITIVTENLPVTIATVDERQLPAVGASLQLPLDRLAEAEPGSTAVFYAGQPGSFDDLADSTRQVFGLDGQVVIDPHLTGPGAVTERLGPADASAINLAIGMLIGLGRTPEAAQLELSRQAAGQDLSLAAAARQLLQSLPPPAVNG